MRMQVALMMQPPLEVLVKAQNVKGLHQALAQAQKLPLKEMIEKKQTEVRNRSTFCLLKSGFYLSALYCFLQHFRLINLKSSKYTFYSKMFNNRLNTYSK